MQTKKKRSLHITPSFVFTIAMIAVKILLTLEDVVDDEAGSQSQESALPPSSAPPPLRDLFGKRCCASSSAGKMITTIPTV